MPSSGAAYSEAGYDHNMNPAKNTICGACLSDARAGGRGTDLDGRR